ncbi:hypothetical protein [Chryseobacterium sp. sg2396]|uniref:hypothetical protein n=1 Tax=Chryseobacterium sp. sg2396 TaxID=3276280 RepID=UPI00366C7166
MNTDFKIKFDGRKHEIDANILINNLIHTTTIIQEINRNLDSGKKIEINVKALEKGSFLIHIGLDETFIESLKNLLTMENMEVAVKIISAFTSIIKLKKFLKGKDAEKTESTGDKVKIQNEQGQVIYVENFVQNIYNNHVINDALSKSFETLENDESITGYEITDSEENPLVRVERSDFEVLATSPDQILEGENVIKVLANINILRISFEEKLKSDFYYKGHKISSKINDPDFYKRIDKGEKFSKGDMLEVELEIKQIFDKTVNTYINKSYKICKIINHSPRGEQASLDF